MDSLKPVPSKHVCETRLSSDTKHSLHHWAKREKLESWKNEVQASSVLAICINACPQITAKSH
jgi:hypothetical protein